MTQERMQQRASLQAFLDGSLVDRAPNLSTSLSHQQREEQTPSPSQLEQLAYRMVSHDGVPTITLQEKQDDYDTFENDTLCCFSGEDACQWLLDEGFAKSNKDVLALGAAILEAGYFRSIDGMSKPFQNNSTLYEWSPALFTACSHDDSYNHIFEGSITSSAFDSFEISGTDLNFLYSSNVVPTDLFHGSDSEPDFLSECGAPPEDPVLVTCETDTSLRGILSATSLSPKKSQETKQKSIEWNLERNLVEKTFHPADYQRASWFDMEQAMEEWEDEEDDERRRQLENRWCEFEKHLPEGTKCQERLFYEEQTKYLAKLTRQAQDRAELEHIDVTHELLEYLQTADRLYNDLMAGTIVFDNYTTSLQDREDLLAPRSDSTRSGSSTETSTTIASLEAIANGRDIFQHMPKAYSGQQSLLAADSFVQPPTLKENVQLSTNQEKSKLNKDSLESSSKWIFEDDTEISAQALHSTYATNQLVSATHKNQDQEVSTGILNSRYQDNEPSNASSHVDDAANIFRMAKHITHTITPPPIRFESSSANDERARVFAEAPAVRHQFHRTYFDKVLKIENVLSNQMQERQHQQDEERHKEELAIMEELERKRHQRQQCRSVKGSISKLPLLEELVFNDQTDKCEVSKIDAKDVSSACKTKDNLYPPQATLDENYSSEPEMATTQSTATDKSVILIQSDVDVVSSPPNSTCAIFNDGILLNHIIEPPPTDTQSVLQNELFMLNKQHDEDLHFEQASSSAGTVHLQPDQEKILAEAKQHDPENSKAPVQACNEQSESCSRSNTITTQTTDGVLDAGLQEDTKKIGRNSKRSSLRGTWSLRRSFKRNSQRSKGQDKPTKLQNYTPNENLESTSPATNSELIQSTGSSSLTLPDKIVDSNAMAIQNKDKSMQSKEPGDSQKQASYVCDEHHRSQNRLTQLIRFFDRRNTRKQSGSHTRRDYPSPQSNFDANSLDVAQPSKPQSSVGLSYSTANAPSMSPTYAHTEEPQNSTPISSACPSPSLSHTNTLPTSTKLEGSSASPLNKSCSSLEASQISGGSSSGSRFRRSLRRLFGGRTTEYSQDSVFTPEPSPTPSTPSSPQISRLRRGSNLPVWQPMYPKGEFAQEKVLPVPRAILHGSRHRSSSGMSSISQQTTDNEFSIVEPPAEMNSTAMTSHSRSYIQNSPSSHVQWLRSLFERLDYNSHTDYIETNLDHQQNGQRGITVLPKANRTTEEAHQAPLVSEVGGAFVRPSHRPQQIQNERSTNESSTPDYTHRSGCNMDSGSISEISSFTGSDKNGKSKSSEKQSSANLLRRLMPQRSKHNTTTEPVYVPLHELQHTSSETLKEWGVNPAAKELHLSDEDFYKAFGCWKVEFAALPSWRQQQKKRKAHLF